MGTRESQVIEHTDVASSFGRKMRIKKVGGKSKGVTVSCLRHLCFSEEEMRQIGKVVGMETSVEGARFAEEAAGGVVGVPSEGQCKRPKKKKRTHEKPFTPHVRTITQETSLCATGQPLPPQNKRIQNFKIL
ncbi:hypothetical protein E2C01_043141 [Portunus trituberculatus]|uniref:Uncharacterized protein n=1 Tax=Portunus trituberculatus TaxID=210409 RepID=A0A5B7FS48_PORTR|nr:hypothetical protein [Portunus trituberculatus]